MEPAAGAEEGELECGYGRCIKDHALHCCHVARSQRYFTDNPKLVLCGWVCVFCGKRSRAVVLARNGPEPLV